MQHVVCLFRVIMAKTNNTGTRVDFGTIHISHVHFLAHFSKYVRTLRPCPCICYEVRTYPASERASYLTGISIIGLTSNRPLIDPSLGKITVSISTAVYDSTKVKVPTQLF